MIIFLNWSEKSALPTIFLNLYILSHHKFPVPMGLDAKGFLIQQWIKKPIHSVGDKIWIKSFEVYDTDSPVGEV